MRKARSFRATRNVLDDRCRCGAADHAGLAGMGDDKIASKTGRTWQEWMRVLDALTTFLTARTRARAS